MGKTVSLISGSCVSCAVAGCERCDFEDVCSLTASATASTNSTSGSVNNNTGSIVSNNSQ